MTHDEYLPSRALSPFIKAYKIIGSRAEITNRILPDTSFPLAFRLRGQVSLIVDKEKIPLPFATFSGLRKSAKLINYAANAKALIVLFKEGAIQAFFRDPVHELFNQSLSLQEMVPRSEISEIEERLNDTAANASKIVLIEKFLLRKLTYREPDKMVIKAISKIKEAKGNLKVKELVNHLYVSRDVLEKRFRKATGATPKQFAHIIRMNAVIKDLPTTSSLQDIAFQSGHYDLPHFTKNFKTFTGQTPLQFSASPNW